MEIYESQQISLEILLEFRRVCETLGLRYYLTAGTLLGAVRHKGFIPWDDDIDVAMPRKDYDVFVREGQKLLGEGLFLQDYHSEPNFPRYYAKICKNETTVLIPAEQGLPIHRGVFIDIFPLDLCPENDHMAKAFFKMMELIKCALFFRIDNTFVCKYRKRYMRFLWSCLCRCPNKRLYLLWKIVRQGAERISAGERFCTVDGSHGFPAESYRAEWFSQTVELEFEGHSFPAPGGWEKLLENMYGDYMTPPPEEDRQGHFKE